MRDCVTLVKDGEMYVFIYDSIHTARDQLCEMADDDELDFSWNDAVAVGKRMTELSHQDG